MWIRSLANGHDDYPITFLKSYKYLIFSGSLNGRISVWNMKNS